MIEPLDTMHTAYAECRRVGFTPEAIAALSQFVWGPTPSHRWPAGQRQTMATLLSMTAQAGGGDPAVVAIWSTLAQSPVLESVIARIREGDPVDDVSSAVLPLIRAALATKIDARWTAFVATLDQSLTTLSTLGRPGSTFEVLMAEVAASRRSVSMACPRHVFDAQDDERFGCLVDVRNLAIHQATTTDHENAALALVFSPLDKVFDLGLTASMEAIETCLEPLHLTWIARQPLVAFQPDRHTLIKAVANSPATIRLGAPGLTRNGRPVLKAWGEPAVAVKTSAASHSRVRPRL